MPAKVARPQGGISVEKYIRAQDLIDRIYLVDPENDGADGCTIVFQNLKLSSPEIEAIVEEIPAADVAPVVHGIPMLRYRPERFVRYEACGSNENGKTVYLKRVFVDEKSYAMYCPACGKRLCSRFKNFCPNCGAKMDK